MVNIAGTTKVAQWSHGHEIDESLLARDLGSSGSALYVSIADDCLIKRSSKSTHGYGAICQDMSVGGFVTHHLWKSA